ncbi:hypothetical protein [Okeania sp. SIO2B3]|uniref:hypothetical protein n=1 Tax=Okeania sp. SIO2B3 TaxID=2607784 RepID=UPI0013C2001F|nr:hypothetical protein [Okeania sp. SIO2B3]NET40612.1 hypothetical protein [Okeania sp. SIO2B3]
MEARQIASTTQYIEKLSLTSLFLFLLPIKTLMQHTIIHEDPFIFLAEMPRSRLTLEDGKLLRRTSFAIKFLQELPPLHPFIIHSQEEILICILDSYGVRKRDVEMIPSKVFVELDLCPAVIEIDCSLTLMVYILGSISGKTSQEEVNEIVSQAASFKACSDFLKCNKAVEKRYISTEIKI